MNWKRILCFFGIHRGWPIFLLHPEKRNNPNSVLEECTRCHKVKSPYGWVKL